MARKITLTIPDSLYKRLEDWRSSFNLSRMFQDTVADAIQRKEELQRRLGEDWNLNEIISRLKKEKNNLKQSFYAEGVKAGQRWAGTVHYADLLSAAEALESEGFSVSEDTAGSADSSGPGSDPGPGSADACGTGRPGETAAVKAASAKSAAGTPDPSGSPVAALEKSAEAAWVQFGRGVVSEKAAAQGGAARGIGRGAAVPEPAPTVYVLPGRGAAAEEGKREFVRGWKKGVCEFWQMVKDRI